jgi:hypothetical protein
MAGRKQGKRTPFFLSDHELEELEIPRQIWELPRLELCEKIVLARIHNFGAKGGIPTNDKLVQSVWTKMWEIIHVLANRPRAPFFV